MSRMAENENLSPTAKRSHLSLCLKKKSPFQETTVLVLQALQFGDPVSMDEAKKAVEVVVIPDKTKWNNCSAARNQGEWMKSRSVKVPVDPVLVFAAVYTLKALIEAKRNSTCVVSYEDKDLFWDSYRAVYYTTLYYYMQLS